MPNHTSDRTRGSAIRSAATTRSATGTSGATAADAGRQQLAGAFGAAAPHGRCDAATGQWYLHSFLPEQPDLNWDEPEVEAAMHDVLRFWLDRGVDGFRIDVVYRIAKDPALADNGPGRRHDQDWDTMQARLAGIRGVLEEFGDDRLAVGELHLPTQADVARYVNWPAGLHLAHNFHVLELPWSAGAFRRALTEFYALLTPAAWPAWCLNNHDYSRVAARHGEHAVRVAAMLLCTLRGTPFLFQGEELGLRDVPVTPTGSSTSTAATRSGRRCPGRRRRRPVPARGSRPASPGCR